MNIERLSLTFVHSVHHNVLYNIVAGLLVIYFGVRERTGVIYEETLLLLKGFR